MKRVMIVGGPGSGKSTLAVLLGHVTGLPVYHMDKIHYSPGWVEREKAIKNQMTHEVHVLEQWIFEGGHSATYAERIARADLFIWLDIPLWKRMYRVLRRCYIHHGQVRPDMQEDCPERFDLEMIKFLRFIIRTRHSARLKLARLYNDPPKHTRALKLTTQADIDTFVESVRRDKIDNNTARQESLQSKLPI